jgi:hypothetical protein
MQSTNTLSIFVIHSEKDDEILQKIKTHFQDQWYWKKDLKPTKFEIDYLDSSSGQYNGADFGIEIRRRIEKARFFIIILTENSKNSVWVNQEIGYVYCKSMRRCRILTEQKLIGESLGFIHSNVHAQSFTLKNFSLGTIEQMIINEYGKPVVPEKMEVEPYVV